MTLAAMRSVDEDALICDFAETYHILDYRALPVEQQAVLASGLRDNSRSKMKLSGLTHIPAEFAAIHAADYLGRIFYYLAGEKGSDPPELLINIMNGSAKTLQKPKGFASGAEFEAARARILAEVNDSE